MDELNEDSILEIPKPILIEDLGTMFATESSKRKYRFGLYKCGLCGTKFKTVIAGVKSGNTNSCGCYNKIKVSESIKKHGMSNTRLYNILKKITFKLNFLRLRVREDIFRIRSF